MAISLFHRDPPPDKSAKPTPHQLIEQEIAHLRKGSSTRRSPHEKARRSVPWAFVLVALAAGALLFWDPPMHAWYKGEAVHTYLYLHNYTEGPLAGQLAATHILSPEEIDNLRHRTGSFDSYYASPAAAQDKAKEIIAYMNGVQRLHDGQVAELGPFGKVRYYLFIKTGLGDLVPTKWDFLDPTVGE